MTDDQRDQLLIDMHGKVTKMHGVLYENGLVKKVEEHETKLRDGYLTCPIGAKLNDHLQEHKDKKYNVPAAYLVVVGLVSMAAPFVERLIFK